MAQIVKVPLNEPGLGAVRRNPDGSFNEEDREVMCSIYRVLGPTPKAVLEVRNWAKHQ